MPYRQTSREPDLWLWLDQALEASMTDPEWARQLAEDVVMESGDYPDVRLAARRLLADLSVDA